MVCHLGAWALCERGGVMSTSASRKVPEHEEDRKDFSYVTTDIDTNREGVWAKRSKSLRTNVQAVVCH